MISGLKIGNFKAFGPAQEIPLRPITLVFGPNSAGKSSIIQSLLLARHIHDTGNVDAHQTTLGGAAVDLGGFMRFVHGHRSNCETTFRLNFKRADITGCFKEIPNSEILSVEYTVGRLQSGTSTSLGAITITSVTVYFDEREQFRLNRQVDGSLCIDANHIREGVASWLKEFAANHGHFGEHVILKYSTLIDELTTPKFTLQGLVLNAVDPLPTESHDFEGVAGYGNLDQPERDPYGFFIRLLRTWWGWDEEPESGVIKALVFRYEIELLLKQVNVAITRTLKSVSYLGPLRWIPPRLIPDGDQFDASWAAGGGEAWQRLRHEPDLQDRVNHFLRDTLRSRYQLECQQFARVRSATAAVFATSSRVAEDPPQPATRLGPSANETITTLSIVDADTGLTVSHRDVGTGISQLLPVLVNAAGAKERLVMIEQPELHLHPALQAELGDVFIESALGANKNTFLIETHSEHLILRLLKRIRQTTGGMNTGLPPVRPEDVAILYVQPTESGSVVQHLRVDQHGRLMDDWPGGFFEEAFNEMF